MIRFLYMVFLIIGVMLAILGTVGTYNLMHIPHLPDGSVIPTSVVVVAGSMALLGVVIALRGVHLIILCSRNRSECKAKLHLDKNLDNVEGKKK